MFSDAMLERAARLLEQYRIKGWRIAAAESCTGGLVAALLTEIPGSSGVFERGFVAYHNEAKMQMLGVREETLSAHGAVSEATAREMAEGALWRSGADAAVSITGIAGPGGGTEEKPVGLVHFACALRGGETFHAACRFSGSRREIRLAAADKALDMLSPENRMAAS